jgi:hypothetical protein
LDPPSTLGGRKLRSVNGATTYDLMLEVDGVLRSQDLRLSLDEELEIGETIAVHGRKWLVTAVVAAPSGVEFDRRAVAREIVETAPD